MNSKYLELWTNVHRGEIVFLKSIFSQYELEDEIIEKALAFLEKRQKWWMRKLGICKENKRAALALLMTQNLRLEIQETIKHLKSENQLLISSYYLTRFNGRRV